MELCLFEGHGGGSVDFKVERTRVCKDVHSTSMPRVAFPSSEHKIKRDS
jgi:hypothetical protein